MTAPIEETWLAVSMTLRGQPRSGIGIAEDSVVIWFSAETFAMQRYIDDARKKMPARAKLAAAAPDLARALLNVEWSGRQDYVGDGGYDCCSCCGGIAPGQETMMDARDDLASGKTVVGHRAECELDAALRKAGVR